MPTKFVLYERFVYQGQMVCIRDLPNLPWVDPNQEPLYTVKTSDGSYRDVPESQLEPTGTFESPLRFDELVEIRPIISSEDIPHEDDAEKAALEGRRGVVTGITLDEDTGRWIFQVALQSGEEWVFDQQELISLGLIVSLEGRYSESQPNLVMQVDPASGHGTIVEGDAARIPHGPTPLHIDLESLVSDIKTTANRL